MQPKSSNIIKKGNLDCILAVYILDQRQILYRLIRLPFFCHINKLTRFLGKKKGSLKFKIRSLAILGLIHKNNKKTALRSIKIEILVTIAKKICPFFPLGGVT